MSRWNVAATAAELNGVPSLKRIPFRSGIVTVSLSFETVAGPEASSGTTCPEALLSYSVSQIVRRTSRDASCGLRSGSRVVGVPVVRPTVSVPPFWIAGGLVAAEAAASESSATALAASRATAPRDPFTDWDPPGDG